MKKKLIMVAIVLIVVAIALALLLNNKKSNQIQEQLVFKQTLEISKEYAVLHHQTENVLLKVMEYDDYDSWKKDLDLIIKDWQNLEKQALELEKNADQIANQDMSFNLIKSANAFDSVEIQKVIESAPAGRQIRTLAKHLGVDVKMAQLILNQTQDQVTREAYGTEGDVFETCEQNSMRIKNSTKVTLFVGGVVLTGGMSGVAASGAVAKTALVVGGADLVLEVTDDEAKIALGDKNKVSEMVGKVRTVTEPAASILTIVSMPGNLSKAIEKINAVSFVGDQIRSVVQDEKILGISIKTDNQGEVKAQISGLTENELEVWKKENNIVASTETLEEILAIKNIEKETKKEISENLNNEINNEGVKEGKISYSEWDDWGDAGSRYKDDLIDKFGNPDVTDTKDGKEMWIYYDLVYNSSGRICSPMYTFYETGQTAFRKCETRENIESILKNIKKSKNMENYF